MLTADQEMSLGYIQKYIDSGKKIKARLVTHGFKEDINNLKKDSPSSSRELLAGILNSGNAILETTNN